ncbi:MAG: Gfo/Idh/MocA family oxidoreductase [Phycisphaerales bacterium]|nr:Gfo/Idh/MocA family oxidoreductase [Phycisphaerales bacterium]
MSQTLPPPLTYAMIGGGTGAFIGEVHRKAIALDHSATLVAGAFSSTPERSIESARQLGLPHDRSYTTYQELVKQEASRPDRVDFVVIVTPNDSHHPIAKAALEAGFHVVLDKPATQTSEQAQELIELSKEHNRLCCVTYNYTGYPMVRQARALIEANHIGPIRKVFVEYHQGWLASDLESTGQKQASWRVDPHRAGIGGAIGDIGTHAENLASFVTGLQPQSIYADLRSFVPNRPLDDDASVFINYTSGAHAVLTASQICIGRGNGLTLRIHGESGSISWNQETPDTLEVTKLNTNPVTYSRGGPDLHDDATISTRIPQGHPEGYLEAFANIYKGATDAIREHNSDQDPSRLAQLIPTIDDGYQGVRFVECCVQSSRSRAAVNF